MTLFSSFKHKKKILIEGHSNIGTGYQMLFKIGESIYSPDYDFHLEGHSEKFPSEYNDSGDIRFGNISGDVSYPIWVEKIKGTAPNRTAYVWVKILDSLDNDLYIYCYYGNANADNVSNGHNVFEFFDDFSTWEGWHQYNGGTVAWTTEQVYVGTHSLKKYNKCDPSGGYKLIGNTIPRGDIVFEAITCRTDNRGCSCTRTGLENSSFNGYSYCHCIGSNELSIDIRTSGSANRKGNFQTINLFNQWYLARLILLPTTVIAEAWDPEYKTQYGSVSTSHSNYQSFDRVAIHGGEPYYIGLIRIRKYADPEPQILDVSNESNVFSKLNGIVKGFDNNPITGKTGKIFILDKDTGYFLATTPINNEGGWYCGHVPVEAGTEVLVVAFLKNGDTEYITSAEYKTTEALS